jgi:hypothetical protein
MGLAREAATGMGGVGVTGEGAGCTEPLEERRGREMDAVMLEKGDGGVVLVGSGKWR